MKNNAIRPATLPQGHRFHFLDALRGIAALLVVPIHGPHSIYKALYFPHAFLAVDLFFCLSGFVVAFSYESRLSARLTFREFVLTRIVRLYPIAILGTILGAMTVTLNPGAFGHQISLAKRLPVSILLGILVIPIPHVRLFPLDYPMWTLFFEMVANVAYAWLMRRRLASSRTLGAIASLSFLAMAVQRKRLGSLDYGSMFHGSIMGLFRVGFSFFCGVLLYRLYKSRELIQWRGNRALVASVFITVLFLGVFCVEQPITTWAPVELCFVAIGFPCFVYYGARVDMPGRWATISAFLGTISYPLYLLHQPLLVPIGRFNPSNQIGANTVMLLSMTALVVLSWCVAKYYDEPIRSALTRWLRGRSMLASSPANASTGRYVRASHVQEH